MSLFSLFRQHDVLTRNIEESERRLKDIKQMKKEGLITNNDVLRSEMQLTNDRLSLTETENSIALVSQQLDILPGINENCLLLPDTALLYRSIALEKYDDYVAQACMNDPGILLLRKQTEVAQNDVRLAKAEYLPNIIALCSEYTGTSYLENNGRHVYNNWNIGLSVSYPLSSLYKKQPIRLKKVNLR